MTGSERRTQFTTVNNRDIDNVDNDGLSRLHSTDEDAVLWLTSYGSRNAYEKKKTIGIAIQDPFSQSRDPRLRNL